MGVSGCLKRVCRRTKEQQSSPDTPMTLCQILSDTKGMMVHSTLCDSGTILRAVHSAPTVICSYFHPSISHCWIKHPPPSNMSPSEHLHISCCHLNNSESSGHSSSSFSTNHPVYHHSHQKRREEQVFKANWCCTPNFIVSVIRCPKRINKVLFYCILSAVMLE